MSPRLIQLSIAAAVLCTGCPKARFVDAPVAWSVRDDADIPIPEETPFYAAAYMADAFVMRRSTRARATPSSSSSCRRRPTCSSIAVRQPR